MTNTTNVPLVSAILVVRNEARHIESVLKSLLEQETRGFQLEIIVVDGESSDGTREIIEGVTREVSRVRLVSNKHRKTPFAFNLGIEHARGEYICILGAHTSYAKDYVAVCLEELIRHGAVGCSGRVNTRPGDNTWEASLVAWALGHPFGTSSRSARTHPTGFADTLAYPVLLKRAFIEVGCYDTSLDRNQDLDMNQRLRAKGYTLYLTGETSCDYFVSPTIQSLAHYAFKTGYWNWLSVKHNGSSMGVRHFVPFAFVVLLFGGFMLFLSSWLAPIDARVWLRAPLVLVCMAYALCGMAATCHVGIRENSLKAILLLPVFFVLHFSYGIGTFWSLATNASASRTDGKSSKSAARILDEGRESSTNQSAI